MAVNPFVVDVADMIRSGGSRHEHIEAGVDWSLEFSRLDPGVPIVADLVLRAVPGGVVATGDVAARVIHTCVACLEPFAVDVRVRAAAMFEAEPDEETYLLDAGVVDLEQMLRDEVMLALPLVPRCDAAHERVVTTAGTDLNTDLPESPFAALRGLIEPDVAPGSEEAR